MIADLKPYPEYKESALPWLGRIPAHWEVMRNGRLFAQRNETGYSDLPILEVSLKTGVRLRNFDESKRKQVMADRAKYKRAKRGDIAYNMMRMWQGALGCVPADGLVSPAYVVARPFEGADPFYFSYLFRTAAFQQEVNNASRGIVSDRNRLYWVDFKQLPSAVPPPEEQAGIVRFLGWAKVRLDKAIRAKRKVIELLNEQKQAIIYRAVTRGMNPDVRFRNSGIPWLGEIPEHWVLKRFKFIATINKGQVDPRDKAFNDLTLIAPNHIQIGSGKLILEQTAQEQGADSGKYLVRKGQIVYSKIRPNLRKAVIAHCDCLCSADMYPISPQTDEISTEYLLLLLLSVPFTKYAIDSSMRVAMPKVNRDALNNCWLWFPSLDEQQSILDLVTREISPFDSALSSIEREISLLREFRIRLIADVVMGKLDVRESAQRLPEESDDTESVEDGDAALDFDDESDEIPKEAEALP